MQTPDQIQTDDTVPLMPRRFVLAGILSALTVAVAGGGLWLAQNSLTQTESFRFSRNTSWAAGEEARLRSFLAIAAQDPTLNVIIVGHTGDVGDADANIALSEARAEHAAQLAQSIGVASEQIFTNGIGGAAPLPRAEGQSTRAHQAALARVDVTLRRSR